MIPSIQSAFKTKFGRDVSSMAIAVACGIEKDLITNYHEIEFCKTAYKYYQAKLEFECYLKVPESPAATETFVFPEIVADGEEELSDLEEVVETHRCGTQPWFDAIGRRSDDKALMSELLKIPDCDITKWREWVEAEPATTASKRCRLQYIVKWANEGKTMNLYAEIDGKHAKVMLDKINLDLKMGHISADVGKKTQVEKLETQSGISEKVYAEGVKLPAINPWNLFGLYLPSRRTHDATNFMIFETPDQLPSEDVPVNGWIRSTQSFYFADFKNVGAFGRQTISVADVLEIAPCKERVTVAVNWLQSLAVGSRLIDNCKNPTMYFKRNNLGFTANDFRHYLESVTSRDLTREQKSKLNYWLCHSPGTASAFYTDS